MIETYAERLKKENRPTITAGPKDVDEHHPIMDPQIPEFPWKYGEGSVLKDLETHIKATYSSHYSTANNDIQTIDVFAYRGTLATTSIDNAIKYLMRYGKKKGKNETDLLKALHYIILAIGYEREEWK